MDQPTAPKLISDKERWEDLVSKSGGSRVFLPEQFLKEANEMVDDIENLNEQVAKLNKIEIRVNVRSQNFWLKVREYFEKNGRPNIWANELGWESEAAKKRIFVVNIQEKA